MSDVFLIYGPPEDEIASAGTDDISNHTRPTTPALAYLLATPNICNY